MAEKEEGCIWGKSWWVGSDEETTALVVDKHGPATSRHGYTRASLDAIEPELPCAVLIMLQECATRHAASASAAHTIESSGTSSGTSYSHLPRRLPFRNSANEASSKHRQRKEPVPSGSQSGAQRHHSRQPTPERIRVAIIGTGLAGLVAAYHLTNTPETRGLYDVHLFERSNALGLDAASFTVGEHGDEGICPEAAQEGHKRRKGERRWPRQRIDVPMRSINAGYYPNLLRLYRRLGIQMRPSNFTFSFASLVSPARSGDGAPSASPAPFLLYNGQSGLGGLSLLSRYRRQLRTLAKTSRDISSAWNLCKDLAAYARFIAILLSSYVCLLFMALYHHAAGHLLDPRHNLCNEPLHEWTSRHQRTIHPTFVHAVLVPLFSAVATSSHAAVLGMSTAEMLLYVATTFLRSHLAVDAGVKQVQEALTRNVDPSRVHLKADVTRIVRQAQKSGMNSSLRSTFRLVTSDAAFSDLEFDHVILATPAFLSANLVQTCRDDFATAQNSKEQQRLEVMQKQLTYVKYETSVVVTHTDETLLPEQADDCRDLNLVTPILPACNREGTDGLQDSIANGKMHKHYTAATHILRRIVSGDKAADRNGRDASSTTNLMQTTNPIQWPSAESILSTSSFQRAITPSSKSELEGLFEWRKAARARTLCPASVPASQWQRLGFAWRKGSTVADDLLQLRSDTITELVAAMRSTAKQLFPLRRPAQMDSDKADDGSRHSLVEGEDHSCSPRILHLGPLQASQTQKDAPPDAPCLWVCGSYAQGIPLLEGCVTSSTLVAQAILHDARRQGVTA